jgi:hypothetical protein
VVNLLSVGAMFSKGFQKRDISRKFKWLLKASNYLLYRWNTKKHPFASLNRPVVCYKLFHSSLLHLPCYPFLQLQKTPMAGKKDGKDKKKGRGDKRKCPMTPSEEGFGDSRLSDERTPPPSPASLLSVCIGRFHGTINDGEALSHGHRASRSR